MTRFPLLKEFLYFINERWLIHERRKAGQPAPWTKDEILRTYRFCNVRREDDRVTKWIHQHWLKPNEASAELWFAMTVARLVNWPPSLTVLKPLPWNAERFVVTMEVRRARYEKIFTSAYMIRAEPAEPGKAKVHYLAKSVLTPMWAARKSAPRTGTLEGLYHWLLPHYGMGSFLAAQIVADVKWSMRWRSAPDWSTFAAPGPGSKRGLNRILGRDPKVPWKDAEWHDQLLALRGQVLPKLPEPLRSLDAQNLQNCLCEFDKYQRVKLNEGRPRQNFTPSKENY